MILKCGDTNFKYAWLDYISQDPVHPSLNVYKRIIGSRTIFVFTKESNPEFIVSARLGSNIARSMREILLDDPEHSNKIVTFYSIFRVPEHGQKGTGGDVLKHIIDYCKLRGTEKFYTLSPIPFLKNEFKKVPAKKKLNEYLVSMTGPVERFHLKNGATVANINIKADDSDIRESESWGTMVNYDYNNVVLHEEKIEIKTK